MAKGQVVLSIVLREMLCDHCGKPVYFGYSTARGMKGKQNYYHSVRGSSAGFRRCEGKRTVAACK